MYTLSIVRGIYKGRECPRLICLGENGAAFEFFPYQMFFMEMIDAQLSANSVKKYGYDLLGFIGYLLVGFQVAGRMSTSIATQLCHGYYSYLVHGVSAADPLIKKIGLIYPRTNVKTGSARNYHSVVTQFVCLADIFITDLRQNKTLSPGHAISLEMMMSLQGFCHHLLMVGRISLWGAGRKNVGKKGRLYRDIPRKHRTPELIDSSKFFPLESISELISKATCYRDAAIWCLLAASGLRISEVLQLLWEDVDVVEGKVYAMNPTSRGDISSSYFGLDELEINRLSWKGRRTKHTFLIEPYAKLFFEALSLYMRHEYDRTAYHDFLFQGVDGKPLRFSDYEFNIVRPFRAAATLVLGEQAVGRYRMKLHSLRHSYCVFLKNFILHTEGMGLSDAEIILLTGHASVESIQTYAIIDRVKVEEKLALAFAMSENRNRKSFSELMLTYHSQRAETFKKMVEKEKQDKEGCSCD